MEEEYKKIDEIINKVLESNGAIRPNEMYSVFREITKAALNEGFEAGYSIGYDSGHESGYKTGFSERFDIIWNSTEKEKK